MKPWQPLSFRLESCSPSASWLLPSSPETSSQWKVRSFSQVEKIHCSLLNTFCITKNIPRILKPPFTLFVNVVWPWIHSAELTLAFISALTLLCASILSVWLFKHISLRSSVSLFNLKHPKSYHFKWSLFPSALSIWDKNSRSLDTYDFSLLRSHRKKEPSDIDATDVELQQVRRWTKFWWMTSPLLSSQCCTSAGFVPWEFCNGLAWDTPGIQSSREGFPCKLQTQIYCREGNLWAPANEARWNRPFPGNSEEALWRQLAHCPATCWKCKLWAVVLLSGEKNRDTGGTESLHTLRNLVSWWCLVSKWKKKIISHLINPHSTAQIRNLWIFPQINEKKGKLHH